MAICVIGYGGAVACFGFARMLWLGVLFLAVSGAADMVSAAYRSTILQVAAPDNLRGRSPGGLHGRGRRWTPDGGLRRRLDGGADDPDDRARCRWARLHHRGCALQQLAARVSPVHAATLPGTTTAPPRL